MPQPWRVTGHRVLVTGATQGLGASTALALAGSGAELVLTSRSRLRADEVAARIRASGGSAEPLELDLASLRSVDEAAAEVSAGGPLTVLVNNAGIGGGRGVTDDGFELVMGTNYVGGFALTAGLRDALLASPIRPRIVIVSSNAHLDARPELLFRLEERTRSVTGFPEYRASKLAQVLWSRELARRWSWADIFCVHPGMVATGIWGRVPQPLRWWLTRRMLSPGAGARTQVRCASDPALVGQSGRYWDGEVPRPPSEAGQDQELAERLWSATEAALSARSA